VLIEPEGPIALARRPEGAALVRARLRDALEALGPAAPPYRESPYLLLRRGQYIIAAAPGSGADPILTLRGRFVDLLDGDLPARTAVDLRPGGQVVLVDLDRLDPSRPYVVAASGRVRDEQVGPGRLRFTVCGPAGTPLVARLLLPAPPGEARVGAVPVPIAWDATSGTALLRHLNAAEAVMVEVGWGHPSTRRSLVPAPVTLWR
jgi:hypothetical protein